MKAHLPSQPLLLALSILVTPGFVTGCATCKKGKTGEPQAYNLHVNLGDTLKDQSVVVDVIAANPFDMELLKNYSVNKYWKPGDPQRPNLSKATFNFVGGKELSGTLDKADPRWKQWMGSGVQYLVVIADLPGALEDKVGSQDPRRKIVPICECYWPSGTKDLAVEIQANGVHVITGPRLEGPALPPGW